MTMRRPIGHSLDKEISHLGKKSQRFFVVVATVILVIAAVLRLVYLQDLPPGLMRDEALNADIASLILDGRYALFFREGYGHEPLYHYLAAPFQLLLGDNFLAIRLPSAYLGLLLVAVTMLWARHEFGTIAGLMTGAFLAVSWWPIIFSRIGLRPILEPLLLVTAFWFWFRRPWLAGVFLGISVYSYTAARVFLIFPLLFLIYQFLLHKQLKTQIVEYKATLTILVVSILVYLPLGFTLLADPTLQERVRQLSGPLDAFWGGNPLPILQTIGATLGVFTFTGDPLWSYSWPNRPLFDPVTGLCFYFGLALVFWYSRYRPVYGLSLIWLALSLAPGALAPDAPSIIRLVGAIPIVYLLPSLAVSWLWSNWFITLPARTRWSFKIGVLIVFSLIVLNFYRTGDSFVNWPSASPVRQKYQSIWLDISRHWRDYPAGALVVADSWYEPIKDASLRRDYGHDLPARWVQGGKAVVFPDAADSRLYVPEFAPLSAELATLISLDKPLYRSQGLPSFAVYALPSAPNMLGYIDPIPFVFPGATEPVITLLAFQIVLTDGDQGRELVTYWRVESFLPSDLTIFTHLLNQEGQIVAQHDGLDAAAGTLQPGDTIIQLHVIPVTGSGGPFTLQTGLYILSDGRRLIPVGQPGDAVVVEKELFFDEKE